MSHRALFFGLGADGTVEANKNSVKILAKDPDRYAQGYFVYDSHKSGAETISHLRFGNTPIAAPYLLRSADFIDVHKFDFLQKRDVLAAARPGATVLINVPYDPASMFEHLSQQHIVEKKLRLFVIDASGLAQQLGLGQRVNTSCKPASSRSAVCCRARRAFAASASRSKRPMPTRVKRFS